MNIHQYSGSIISKRGDSASNMEDADPRRLRWLAGRPGTGGGWSAGRPARTGGRVTALMSRGDRPVRPVEVRAPEPYRIWLRHDGGVEGGLDLSYLAGDGVRAAWEDHSSFSAVRLGPCGSNRLGR